MSKRPAAVYPQSVPQPPITPCNQKPTPPSVLLHRERIDASRRGEGPFYTKPKVRRAQ